MNTKTPMNYKVIQDTSIQRLADAVNKLMQDGWVPVGGICMTTDQGRTDYAQAMIG